MRFPSISATSTFWPACWAQTHQFSAFSAKSYQPHKVHHKLARRIFTTGKTLPRKNSENHRRLLERPRHPQKAAIMSWKFFFSSHNHPLFLKLRWGHAPCWHLNWNFCATSWTPSPLWNVDNFPKKSFPRPPFPDSFSPKALYFLRKSCERNILRISIFFFFSRRGFFCENWWLEGGR